MVDLGNNNKIASQKKVCNTNESVQHSKCIYLIPCRCYV